MTLHSTPLAMVFDLYLPAFATRVFSDHAGLETPTTFAANATIKTPVQSLANSTADAPVIDMPGSIASRLVTALGTLKHPVMDVADEIILPARAVVTIALGLALTALALYAICTVFNLVAAPFTRKKTVGQLVAKSLGETAGKIVVAWKEGWAIAEDENNNAAPPAKQVRLKDIQEVLSYHGLRLIVEPSVPTAQEEEDEEFQLISEVMQEEKAVRRFSVGDGKPVKDGDSGLVEDPELVQNHWGKKI